MKIRMITLAAWPGGIAQPGQEVDLPAETAQVFVAGGYAVPVRSAPEMATLRAPETRDLASIPGIRAEIAHAMAERGITSANLADVDDKMLLAIPGLGKATVKKIRAATRTR